MIMSKFSLNKIVQYRWIVRALIPSIFFCLRFLPWRQAIKLPILIYKPKLNNCSGKFIIESPKVKFGMIILGHPNVPLYPNDGIMIQNMGTIVFKGSCDMGNNTAISIGKHGVLTIGDEFSASTSLKLVCWSKVSFNERVRFGWDCMILDTDFHKMTYVDSPGCYTKGYGLIEIGKGCWIGSQCVIMKNTLIPPFTTVAAGSVCSGCVDVPPYSVVGSDKTLKVIKTGVYRNIDDDEIDWS